MAGWHAVPRGTPVVDKAGWRIWRTRDGIEAHVGPDEHLTPLPVVVRLRLDPTLTPTLTYLAVDGSDDPITAVGVREIRVGLIATVAAGRYFDKLEPEQQLDLMYPQPRQQARTTNVDALMTQAVDAYRQAVSRGSRKPTEDAARALGYSRSHIARLLVQARKRKPPLLDKGKRGKR